MSGDAAAAVERLPWLAEDAAEEVERPRGRSPMMWLAPLALLVGAGVLWMVRSSAEIGDNLPNPRGNSTVTVHLPEAMPVAVEAPVIELKKLPIVVPEAPKTPKIAAKTVEVPVKSASPSVKTTPANVKTVVVKPKKPASPPPPAGRVIQVGAFGSSAQASDARLTVLKTYPAIAHLTNGVTATRNSKGREYYRFQLNTTSQAHSEVLCQRMQKIGLSCTVVGMPEKANQAR